MKKKDIIDHLAICTDNISQSVNWYLKEFNCAVLTKTIHGQC